MLLRGRIRSPFSIEWPCVRFEYPSEIALDFPCNPSGVTALCRGKVNSSLLPSGGWWMATRSDWQADGWSGTRRLWGDLDATQDEIGIMDFCCDIATRHRGGIRDPVRFAREDITYNLCRRSPIHAPPGNPWWRHLCELFPHYWSWLEASGFPHKGPMVRTLLIYLLLAWTRFSRSCQVSGNLRRLKCSCDVTRMRSGSKPLANACILWFVGIKWESTQCLPLVTVIIRPFNDRK